MKLNQSNLSKIGERIKCPNYDRLQLKTGIVHIGVGGFHRSHQAYYIHQLLEKFKTMDWSICGVGLLESDRKMSEVLKSQDGLYTLVVQHPDGRVDCEIVGSIHEYLLAVESPDLVIDRMAEIGTKIVSLTITEGGYNFDPNTGEFNFENEDIQHDLENPDSPKTVYGFLTAALSLRKANGNQPFTIMSCDNIQHNGDITRKMLLAFAKRQNSDLALWIEEEVSFPNTMVDRITPVTTEELSRYLENTHQVTDGWCVVCEPFIQWVVEDKFSMGRPPLEKLGVQFVSDVTPYEKMKIRLLNAGHSVLGIPGAIHGHPTIDACMRDDVFAQFMRKFMDIEVTPVLGKIEGVNLDIYKDSLEERFANPNLKDSVSRICSESSAKLPKFLIPTLKENLAQDGSIKYATFILAAWCYYSDKGVDDKNQPIEIIDVQSKELNQAAKNTENDWLTFLQLSHIFGNLSENTRFIQAYEQIVKRIYQERDIRKLLLALL